MSKPTSVIAKFTAEMNQPSSSNDCNDITLRAVYADGNEENKRFFKWTPTGQINMSVVSQETAGFFEPGEDYFVTFTKATKPKKNED